MWVGCLRIIVGVSEPTPPARQNHICGNQKESAPVTKVSGKDEKGIFGLPIWREDLGIASILSGRRVRYDERYQAKIISSVTLARLPLKVERESPTPQRSASNTASASPASAPAHHCPGSAPKRVPSCAKQRPSPYKLAARREACRKMQMTRARSRQNDHNAMDR